MTISPGRFTAFSAVLLAALAGNAAADITGIPIPAAPQLNAKAYIAIDALSGEELAAHNPDARVKPASLTKLMSAYVIFHALAENHIALDDEVPVSRKAYKTPGSRMFIEQNSEVSVEDLLHGMIVQSGNDASVALAEYVAGTEGVFADLMNQFAAGLGMLGSNFENATGLPGENHYTTARDMATLARAIITEFPDYYRWYSTREFTYNGITQRNRNRLLWRDSSVDGMKTGHTDRAGYCLVSSAVRNGMRLISVVMGSPSSKVRTDASQALLNYGFRFYETHRLFAAGESVEVARVWKGASETARLGLAEDLYVTVPRGSYDRLTPVVELPGLLVAPVDSGEPLGRLTVNLADTTLAERPLAALESVPEGSFWRRVSDEVRLWFE